jgi:hypothetical protein
VARRSIGGRTALDRAGVAAHTGAAYSTVNHWHRHRARFGFPEGFIHDGTEWFWLADIKAFHAAHQAAKLAELTKVDRRGHPDELVGSGTAAKILGYDSYRNLPDTLLDRADRTEKLPDTRTTRACRSLSSCCVRPTPPAGTGVVWASSWRSDSVSRSAPRNACLPPRPPRPVRRNHSAPEYAERRRPPSRDRRRPRRWGVSPPRRPWLLPAWVPRPGSAARR